MRNGTAPGPNTIKADHLNSFASVIVKTLARLFTRHLSECKVCTLWKTSKTVSLYKKGDPNDIGHYCPVCLLSLICKLFTRVILNRIDRKLDEEQSCEQERVQYSCSRLYRYKAIEVPQEYKMQLCLTFIELKEASDTVETEVVIEVLGNQGVLTQYTS
uniref:HORMA domain-containing protein n=1 Tax=Haemonchus contortus TaxID=6289 RepID=A0A7I4Y7B9_HAECO